MENKTTQSAKRARRPAKYGAFSIGAPIVGAFLGYVLIYNSQSYLVLGFWLVALSVACGIALAVSAWIRRERHRFLPSVGLLMNLALGLWVTWIALVLIYPILCPYCSPPLEVFYRHSDPVKSWKDSAQKPNPAIEKDYHEFITKTLPPPGNFVVQQKYLEDGKGQHAVTIEAGRNGTYWTYVLIYDQNSTRIKVIKYISGHYAC